MKKLLQTINETSFFTNGGIFSKIAGTQSQPFEWLTTAVALKLDTDYYYSHSGDKFISVFYDRLLQLEDQEKIADALQTLANTVILRCSDKWNKIYNAYIDSDYAPLENYSMKEVRTPNLTDTHTLNTSHTDTKNLTTEEKQNTDIQQTTHAESSIYGFNSSSPVPQSEADGTAGTTGIDSANKKTRTETGTDTVADSGSDTLVKTGTEELTRNGNIGVTTSQQMLQSELELRKYNFYEEIMRDVDKIMCLSIYLS